MTWWRLRNAAAPWGDYGRILVSGMTLRRDPQGRLPYERTGPFVPPITISGVSDVIVTDEFRTSLLDSGLHGLTFAEVIKKRIVRLDWRTWDLAAPDPAQWPPGNEPENYILRRSHDPDLADALGPIWEVQIDGVVGEAVADFLRTAQTTFSHVLVSDRAADWLTTAAPECVAVEPHA